MKDERTCTIVNRDVIKLVSITFNKMLFLFIISSLFLPHPVYSYNKLYGGFIIKFNIIYVCVCVCIF